jgi:hypothetical protein
MNLLSPIVAMLWENWQLTRVEAAQRLGIGLVAGGGALVLFDSGATIAFWLLMVMNGMCFWLSILKLNGGRLMDGYNPGFPFYLLYSRPVSTVASVGVPMVYGAVSCAALYVVTAALLEFAFGQPLPLFSVVLFIISFHFCYACIQWSTQNRVVQWVGSIAFSVPLFFLLKHRVATSLQVEFSPVDNALLLLVCVVAFVFTVAGVARQRRGDAVAFAPRQRELSGGFPVWLVNLFRLQCPTSSATRAQVWFELKSSGLPVLMVGLMIAIVIMLLWGLSTVIGSINYVAVPVTILAVPLVLFGLGGNAFGIRRKQGRTYASAFELTQPYGTSQLAGLKILVRVACLLVALIAIGASLWTSSTLADWAHWLADGNKDKLPDLLKARQKFADDFGGLTVPARAALAIVAFIGVAGVVAWQAAREALRARYPRLLLTVQWLPTVWGLSALLLALSHRNGMVPQPVLHAFFTASFWISGTGMAIAAIYLLWAGFEQRLLTVLYACCAFAVSAAFAAAWMGGMRAPGIFATLWPALLILSACLLAPWALNRVRHA